MSGTGLGSASGTRPSSQHPYARFAPVSSPGPSLSSSPSSSSPHGHPSYSTGTNSYGQPIYASTPSMSRVPASFHSASASSPSSNLPGALGIPTSSAAANPSSSPRAVKTIPFGLPSDPAAQSQHASHSHRSVYSSASMYGLRAGPNSGSTSQTNLAGSTSSLNSLLTRTGPSGDYSRSPSTPSSISTPSGIGGPASGSGAGALGMSSSGNVSRDFLVPIGATGARQKLSIMSANQRRMQNPAPVPAEQYPGRQQQQPAQKQSHSRGQPPSSSSSSASTPTAASSSANAQSRQQSNSARQQPISPSESFMESDSNPSSAGSVRSLTGGSVKLNATSSNAVSNSQQFGSGPHRELPQQKSLRSSDRQRSAARDGYNLSASSTSLNNSDGSEPLHTASPPNHSMPRSASSRDVSSSAAAPASTTWSGVAPATSSSSRARGALPQSFTRSSSESSYNMVSHQQQQPYLPRTSSTLSYDDTRSLNSFEQSRYGLSQQASSPPQQGQQYSARSRRLSQEPYETSTMRSSFSSQHQQAQADGAMRSTTPTQQHALSSYRSQASASNEALVQASSRKQRAPQARPWTSSGPAERESFANQRNSESSSSFTPHRPSESSSCYGRSSKDSGYSHVAGMSLRSSFSRNMSSSDLTGVEPRSSSSSSLRAFLGGPTPPEGSPAKKDGLKGRIGKILGPRSKKESPATSASASTIPPAATTSSMSSPSHSAPRRAATADYPTVPGAARTTSNASMHSPSHSQPQLQSQTPNQTSSQQSYPDLQHQSSRSYSDLQPAYRDGRSALQSRPSNTSLQSSMSERRISRESSQSVPLQPPPRSRNEAAASPAKPSKSSARPISGLAAASMTGGFTGGGGGGGDVNGRSGSGGERWEAGAVMAEEHTGKGSLNAADRSRTNHDDEVEPRQKTASQRHNEAWSAQSSAAPSLESVDSTLGGSSITPSDPPELDLQLGSAGLGDDLSALIPHYMSPSTASFGKSDVSSDFLSPAYGNEFDKSLPPTPEASSPLTPRASPLRAHSLHPDGLNGQREGHHHDSFSPSASATSPSGSRLAPNSQPVTPSSPYSIAEGASAHRPSAISVASPDRDRANNEAVSTGAETLPDAAGSRRSLGHADAAALARLEASTGAPAVADGSAGAIKIKEPLVAPDASGSVSALKGGPTADEAKRSAPAGVDPKMYVPPGALSHNRKGGVVGERAALLKGSMGGNKKSAAAAVTSVSQGKYALSNGISAQEDDEERSFAPRPSISTTMEASFGLDLDDDADTDTIDNGSTLPASAWAEVEAALLRFRDPAEIALDKGALIRNVLLPFLALEAETPNLEVSEGKFRSSKARRLLFFDWIAHLLIELQHVQTSADRGAILESIACIIESRNLSVTALANDHRDDAKFSSTFGHILLYAIGELNKKGVYQNTLIFSGRLLAVAFFRVKGVASKLLRALPINRFALERVAAEAEWERVVPSDFEQYLGCFPETLRDYCFLDARSYLKVLDAQTSANDESDDDRYLVRQPEVEVEMTGNWLRRWQSDDSELFFSFCRSYHRQLAGLLTSSRQLRRVAKLFFGGPGYAHLATCIHLKCLSLVNRDILSVTTLSSQKNFNPGETANVLSGSTAGKPRHLEAANRRCTAIIVDIVRAPSGNNQVFLPMLAIHIKCLVKKTSLYDVQSVFCLLDWLDGVLGHMDAAELPIESLVDIDFLITTISLLLENADHALALMRTIAFCYSNFAVLISTVAHRRRFCEEILLKRKIFHKLFLSWSFTIRAYFLHLLVFRLARISDFPHPPDDHKGKTAVEVARLFNQRLDEIRRRHDELSPPSPSSSDAGDGDGGSQDGKDDNDGTSSTYSRIRGRPASFVSTIKHTPSIHQPEPRSSSQAGSLDKSQLPKAERVLGIGLNDPMLEKAAAAETKMPRRAAKWLRALGGKGKQGVSPKTGGSSAIFGSPDFAEKPTIHNQPRFKASPLDLSDDDEDEDDSGRIGDDSMDVDDEMHMGAGGSNGRGVHASEYEFDFERPPPAAAGPDGSNALQLDRDRDHIAPDTTFDLQSPQHHPSGNSIAHKHHSSQSQHSHGHGASSPRVSRAFSKRTSILPGPAYELVEGDDGNPDPPVPPIPDHLRLHTDVPVAYPEHLHVYATQGLREWEAVLAEHDEFFAATASAAAAAASASGGATPQQGGAADGSAASNGDVTVTSGTTAQGGSSAGAADEQGTDSKGASSTASAGTPTSPGKSKSAEGSGSGAAALPANNGHAQNGATAAPQQQQQPASAQPPPAVPRLPVQWPAMWSD